VADQRTPGTFYIIREWRREPFGRIRIYEMNNLERWRLYSLEFFTDDNHLRVAVLETDAKMFNGREWIIESRKGRPAIDTDLQI